MQKKVVLITGAGRGIGKQIAKDFSENDYAVVLNYNQSENQAKLLADEIEQGGGDCLLVKADVSDEEQVKEMVTAVLKKYKKIDVLVNNAAIAIDCLYSEKTVENFRKTLDVNLIGTFLVSKYVGQVMQEQKSGKIINISSTNGINTYFPMCLDYDASKAGIISLTHNLAMQFAPYVTVNAIAPGFIATESEIKDMDEEFIAMESEKIFVKHPGSEQDVSNLVLFLASEKADFINNEVIRIDGGVWGS